jgi:predicted nuclease with TOPRIM domain
MKKQMSNKEFWITKTEHNDIVVYEKNPMSEYAAIHVIKYYEYELLKKENTELKSEIERLNNKYDFQLLVKENSDLKTKLDKAYSDLMSLRLRTALKEIGVE